MLKKYLKAIVPIGIIIIGITIYISYHNPSFVQKNFIKYTDVREFSVTRELFDDHQSYIETTISKGDKKKLLTKFQFENTLIRLKGKVECHFISENTDYIYYVKDGSGIYGYILFALEKDGNTFKVYEAFGG